jgi:hypothetical protein
MATQKLQMPLADALGFVARWLDEMGEPEFAGIVRQAVPAVEAHPELLEALRELLDWGRDHTSPRDENSPHELLVNAHAAIRKAEGWPHASH